MDMRQLINANVAVLVVLSALLFGRGQYSLVAQFLAPVIATVAAAAAHVYTDRRQRFQIGRTAVNVAILLIALVTGWLLFRASAVSQSVAIGQALIALQVVLLFENKSDRSRWDLISLSLLTVYVSTGFIHGPSFGLILAIYFFFAFSAFTLLFFQRERQTFEENRLLVAGDRAPMVTAESGTDWWRLVAVALATLAVGPFSLFLRIPKSLRRRRGDQSPDGERHSERRPMGVAINRPGGDPMGPPLVGREFRWLIGRITIVSIVLSLIFFCVVPRFGRLELILPQLSEVSWKQKLTNRRRSAGYNKTVSLGELGAMSENQMMVLTVRFTDAETEQPLKVLGDVYLRGSILTGYADGQWQLTRYAPALPITYHTTDPIVRQKIEVQDLEESDLFCVWPFVKIHNDSHVRFESRSERLHRPQSMASRAFAYELGTTAFDDRVQTELVPCTRVIGRQTLLEWPEEALPGLARQASDWIERAGAKDGDFVDIARILQQRLQSSDRFAYSLDEPPRNESKDPVEDFVTEHPQGNCEFFASALALMLRSQGIPSRLVVGYRASLFRSYNQSYAVRQCDAHAWVEAYIPPEQLVGRELPSNHSDWSRGAWLRLEPTPSTATEMSAMALLAQRMRDAVTWVRTVWRDKVLGMSGAQQRAAIYGPLVDAVKRWGQQLASPEYWAGLRNREFWVVNKSTLGLVWLFCVTLSLVLVLARTRFPSFSLLRRWRRRGGRDVVDDQSTAVAFYEQLERLLAVQGPPRRFGQTQREFARSAGEQLAASSGQQAVAGWIREVVDAYYRVRFGRCDLDRRQAATIASLLAKIRAAIGVSSRLAGNPAPPPRSGDRSGP
jgi:MFS family permease